MQEKYFKHYLKSKGFDDVDQVLYSLGYCQGDGCSFTTQLGVNDIQRLIPFIYTEEASNAPKRFENLISGEQTRRFIQNSDEDSLIINITQQSNHYCHQNTMSFDWEGNIDEDKFDKISDERFSVFEEFGNALMEDIFEYAKDCARELESKGYSLIESFNSEDDHEVWSFKTENFMIKLLELSDTVTEDVIDWDEDLFISTCESMIQGKTVIRSIRSVVYDLRDDPDCDEAIGEDSLWGIICDSNDLKYGSYRRDVVSQAIEQAREYLKNNQDNQLDQAA